MKNYKKYMRSLLIALLLMVALFTNIGLGFCQQATATHITAINQQNNSLDAADVKHAVSDTAYITLYWLTSAGNAKAKLILEHADTELLAKLEKNPAFDKIKVVNTEYQRMRHDSLNSYVLDNHYQAVMDLACGYSPRGLELSEAKITYIGGDFASVVQSMQALTDCCASASQKDYYKYKVVDVTKREQMLAAIADLKGPICIMTEGLFMYLDKEQTAAAINNIAVILKNKGGCFITQDFSTKKFVTAVADALYPHRGEALYRQSADIYNNISNDIMNTEFGADDTEIKTVIKKAGLRYRKLPLNGRSKPSNFEGLNAEQTKRLQNVMEKKYMWVITR